MLGVDPGTAITGYGIVRENAGELEALAYGVICTLSDDPMATRLQAIYRELRAAVAEYRPTSAALEKLFFSKNVRTAMSVGQARGVALLALADADLVPGEYTPMEIKQAVTGYGGAGKSQVQEMVKALLNLADIPRPDDAADALAVAICHLQHSRFEGLIAGSTQPAGE